jgi:predicted DsbA family dithiol-disulfide isomerase
LNRGTPKEGYDLKEYLEKKYGPAATARFSSPDNPLDVAGFKCGIKFNKERRIVNTLDGHRMVEWCKHAHPESHDALMEKIFCAYFEQGKDLSDYAVLLRCAVEAGLNAEEAKGALESGEFRQDIDRQATSWSQQGVNGVPFFIFEPAGGGKPLAFSGAQPVDVMIDVLGRVTTA